MRTDFIRETVSKYKADGVLVCNQKWCDPYLFQQPFLIQELRESGMPVASIEVERDIPIGPLRTRIEAFLEMIEGGK